MHRTKTPNPVDWECRLACRAGKGGVAVNSLGAFRNQTGWSPTLVRMLRGKRTQAQLAELLGVSKNTVWRWEAGYAAPDARHAGRLSKLAERERFLADWKPVGSMIPLGDLEEGSRQITRLFRRSLARTARQLEE